MNRLLRPFIILLAMLAALALWQRGQLEVLALQRIDPLPEARQLVEEGRYAEAAEYLGFFMAHDYVGQNPEAQQLWLHITTERNSWQYQVGKVLEGALQGSSDETVGQIASVVSDFLVIGDLRDLSIQAWRYSRDEETDPVIAALSTLGIAATGAQLLSGAGTAATAGTATPALAGATSAKQSIATLKTMRKLGQLPNWLGDALVHAARTAKDTRSMNAVTDIFNSVKTLGKTPGGLRLLKNSSDAGSLKRMAHFADEFGKHSAMLYRIGGDTALHAGEQLHRLDKASIRLAATYGQRGLRVLDDAGALRFAKYTARAAKIGWKGNLQQLLTRFLLSLPGWALYLILLLGALACLPRKRARQAEKREPAFP